MVLRKKTLHQDRRNANNKNSPERSSRTPKISLPRVSPISPDPQKKAQAFAPIANARLRETPRPHFLLGKKKGARGVAKRPPRTLFLFFFKSFLTPRECTIYWYKVYQKLVQGCTRNWYLSRSHRSSIYI